MYGNINGTVLEDQLFNNTDLLAALSAKIAELPERITTQACSDCCGSNGNDCTPQVND